MLDGIYKVVALDVYVKVTGNMGIHELMLLPLGEVLIVNNGQAHVKARYTLPGELDKHVITGKIKKAGEI